MCTTEYVSFLESTDGKTSKEATSLDSNFNPYSCHVYITDSEPRRCLRRSHSTSISASTFALFEFLPRIYLPNPVLELCCHEDQELSRLSSEKIAQNISCPLLDRNGMGYCGRKPGVG
mmetsp:Transcript_9639/g.10980  ORF Transcript_9639/g.10980 Transcript_9639/m.10980 type:complete len:118 (-) Transcript_9639:830-1183(-)